MELPPELAKHLNLSGNEAMLTFAEKAWHQLEQHAAEGPDVYRKFQDAQLSFALGNTRPQNLSDRKALLKIDTSVLASASRLLLDTAQVCIRIYRAAPSLAASMAGALARGKTQVSAGPQPVQFQMLWQSAKLTADAKGITIIDVECSAKAVDAILDGRSTSSNSGFMQQVLQYVQQHEGVRLAVKSAKLSVLAPQGNASEIPVASSKREDLSQIPAASSHLPASLLSKLSMVKLEDNNMSGSTHDKQHIKAANDTSLPAGQGATNRPLIEEL